MALLRAINVGGTQKLPMTELKAMCIDLGFQKVETYIASGNVVFDSSPDRQACKAMLEQRLAEYFGKPAGVILRTCPELESVLNANPFGDIAPSKVVVLFLDTEALPEMLQAVRHQQDERLHLGKQEILIAYPNGIGRSRLVIDAAKTGTARNINTVQKLAQLAKMTPN